MAPTMARHWLNYINGEWVDSGRRLDVASPATGENFATVALASVEDAELALDAAARCVQRGDLTHQRPEERVRWLLHIAEEIRAVADEGAQILCQENGKRLSDARDEFIEAARYFEYYAGMADKIEGISVPLGDSYVDFTRYEPMGVSVQIVPWNFPVSICARSLAPALAAGNAVIVKSPELSPLGLCVLFQAIQRVGLPRGAVQLLCGLGREVGAHLASSAKTNHIVFTGSVPTGRAILAAAAQWATPSVMELGGKSAAIAFPDCDREDLLASVKSGIFFNTGQVCSAMSRLLVHRDIYDEVLLAVAALANQLVTGPGEDDPDHTPLISLDQLDKVASMCREAVAEGATVVAGGDRVVERCGHFMQPTILGHVQPHMKIACEEVFGPVLCVMPFETEDEAVQIANGTPFGLVGGVFTRDISRALRFTRRLRAGQVFVNEWYAGGIETPFGGVGLSGFGREKGQEAIYSYVRTKNVAIRVADH